jgi:hypothetical protein
MHFHQFLQEVSCELQELLWKDLPRFRLGGELARVKDELHRATAALTQLRTSMEEARNQLAEKERRARWLESRVEIYLHIADRANAWRYALELDTVRSTLDQVRARHQRRRQAYHAQLARVQRLQERVDDAQIEMYSRG